MNIREGARRVRVIAMWMLGIGIAMIAFGIVLYLKNPVSNPMLPWPYFIGAGVALALLAWVLDGFGEKEKETPAETKLRSESR